MGRIETTLGRLGRLDALAAQDTPATRLDPRGKLVVTVAFVAAVASVGRLEVGRLAPLAIFPLVLVPLGDVPWRPLLYRLALAAPLALGVAAFEPLLDRAPALALGDVTVSRGAVAMAVVLAKFLISLGAALLLVATTGFDDVCAAMGRLGVPRVVVGQLSLTYRYLFVLGGEAARMVRAHDLRAPARRHPSFRSAGPLLGNLLVRAMARAERVHAAMRARGFDGRFPSRRPFRLRAVDGVFLGATLAALAVTRLVDVPALLGAALPGGLR